jgi:hypothetical protein
VLRFEEAVGPAVPAARGRRPEASARTVAALVLAGVAIAGIAWALLRS